MRSFGFGPLPAFAGPQRSVYGAADAPPLDETLQDWIVTALGRGRPRPMADFVIIGAGIVALPLRAS
jgi:hypothetical protein